MIQFNLLPDVKIEYIKTKRLKRLMMLGSFVAVGASMLILFLTFSYSAIQKRHMSELNKDIETIKNELDSIPELKKILSVQDQLNALPDLYMGRPALDRLPDYLERTTPSGIGLNHLQLDMSINQIEVTGNANSLETVNSYVDTLKFTTYKTSEEGSEVAPAFNSVVLVQFGRDSNQATFTISFMYDPQIFDISKEIQLSVPNKVTSHAQAPNNNLFNGEPQEGGENAGQ